MAEYAVNISSTSQENPNFFEVLAQESLMNSIDPAIKVICNLLYSQNVEKYRWIIKWYDELFLITNSVIQYYYLKFYNASFSEAYYNLQRVLDIKSSNRRLSPKSLYSSLFFLVGLPYLKKKANVFLTDYELNLESQISIINRRYKLLILKICKIFGNIYEFTRILYLFRYLAGLGKQYSPLLKLSGVVLTYQNTELLSWHEKILSNNMKFSSKILPYTLKTLMTALEIGAFCVHFLRWWYTDESRSKITRLPTPKPPHKDIKANTCPLCNCVRKNEVVLLTSGFVFCFLCIKNYLDENHVCPITLLPSSPDNLIKIFGAI